MLRSHESAKGIWLIPNRAIFGAELDFWNAGSGQRPCEHIGGRERRPSPFIGVLPSKVGWLRRRRRGQKRKTVRSPITKAPNRELWFGRAANNNAPRPLRLSTHAALDRRRICPALKVVTLFPVGHSFLIKSCWWWFGNGILMIWLVFVDFFALTHLNLVACFWNGLSWWRYWWKLEWWFGFLEIKILI